jgi:nitronate monooxygenase
MWQDTCALTLLGIKAPILLAPMAGPGHWELAVAVSEAGGLGALPCAMLSAGQVREEMALIRRGTSGAVNLNFFCHTPPVENAERQAAWRRQLDGYYRELGIDPAGSVVGGSRAPFDEAMCGVVEELRPEVVSFHFGLPGEKLLGRVKAAGARVLSSATTVKEAKWLEERGCDAVIAQGFEAGGHRAMFLTSDVSTQVGTFALVPQVADAVKVPVIASGGIADARGIVAALALGASAVQIGTAYLFCPEARLPGEHRKALRDASEDQTAVTNVFTGRPARGVVNRAVRELGPMSSGAPEFPSAAGAMGPLRAGSEKNGSVDFSPLWCGQAGPLGRELPAAELTRRLADEAMERMRRFGAASTH